MADTPAAETPRPEIAEKVRLFKHQTLAMMEAAEAMTALANVLNQGIRDDNEARGEEIAKEFEKAAGYVRGRDFAWKEPVPTPAAS